ncbi:hypothetical protein [Sphingomonas sp. Ag1]|uniref:hypothetical protein n=1 Tax=Sphingomonas sp. Ag1 TaxID=1642949 RepID=UPI0006975471|nr:hypothetical protein [Sphingomonas sp. Ag1]
MFGSKLQRYQLGCLFLLLASPATAEGPLTVWFKEEPSAVSDKLANLCADRNAAVVEQDDRHVLCQREVSGGKGILAQALLGNSYSTSPVLNVRFSILKDRGAARVQASQWVELQMAMGQTRRTPVDGRKADARLEQSLVAAGGHNVHPSTLQETLPPYEESTADGGASVKRSQ